MPNNKTCIISLGSGEKEMTVDICKILAASGLRTRATIHHLEEIT